MLVDNYFSLGKACTINNACMIVFIAKDHAFAITQGGKDAYIGHIAGVKEQGGLRAFKTGKVGLQLLVELGIARG